MVEIVWKEPPPSAARRGKNALIVAELKKNPGRWALVATDVLTSGAGTAWRKLGCEARLHRKNPGDAKPKYDLYARWPVPKGAPRPGFSAGGTEPAQPKQPEKLTYKPGVSPGLDRMMESRHSRGVPVDGKPAP